MDTTSNVLLGSVIMPPVIALLNQSKWPSPVKGLVALLACLVGAFIAEFLHGGVSYHEWRSTALTVSASAFAAYALWWQPSGIAPVLQDATSVD